MAPRIDKTLKEFPFPLVHGGLVDMAPVALIQVQCFGLGELGVVAQLPRDLTQLGVVGDVNRGAGVFLGFCIASTTTDFGGGCVAVGDIQPQPKGCD